MCCSFFFFLFHLGFTASQDYFTHFWAESVVRCGEIGGSPRKTTWPPQAELDFSHIRPELGSKPQRWDDKVFLVHELFYPPSYEEWMIPVQKKWKYCTVLSDSIEIRYLTSVVIRVEGQGKIWWMDGWVRVLRPFYSISVFSRRWRGEHERLCAMKRRLGSGRISPPAGFEPATPWSEVGSANRSATRTLQW